MINGGYDIERKEKEGFFYIKKLQIELNENIRDSPRVLFECIIALYKRYKKGINSTCKESKRKGKICARAPNEVCVMHLKMLATASNMSGASLSEYRF